MATTEPQLKQIAESFIAAFADLDDVAHNALRSPTCLHHFAPSSLSMPAPKTNADFSTHVNTRLKPVLSHFPVTAKEIHINPTGRQAQITIWATGVPEFHESIRQKAGEEEAFWEYTGEYIFILDVDGEGRISRVVEFLDSLATTRLFGLMGRAREVVEAN